MVALSLATGMKTSNCLGTKVAARVFPRHSQDCVEPENTDSPDGFKAKSVIALA
jgi:hypothetical protein